MNQLAYPDGVMPLDFLVSSIEKDRKEETVDGLPGNVDYGFSYKGRKITINFMNEHRYGSYDYRLLRNELFELFDSYPYLFISDDYIPTRVIRINIDTSYTPERYGMWYSKLELEANISGLPFFETQYTTQDIEQDGYSALVAKYGLADGINIDYPHYTFTENTFNLWNGGNQSINPRNMYLVITVKNLKTDGNFTIENITTGDLFIYNAEVDGKDLVRDGMQLKVGNTNQLRDSNRHPIHLLPRLNEFKVKNGTFDEILFDFKFYTK